jgi:hypothetical protein
MMATTSGRSAFRWWAWSRRHSRRSHAGRVEPLDLLQHALGELDADARLEGHPHQRVADGRVVDLALHGGHAEVAVGIEVPDDEHGHLLLLRRESGESHLPDQVVTEVALPGERGLESWEVLVAHVLVRRGGVALQLVVIEVLVPVDLVGTLLALHLLCLLGLLGERRQLLQLGLGGAGPVGTLLLVGTLVEQRVLVDLGADEIDELQPRELQELDGLLQLGRHHQLLRHLEVLSELQAHGWTSGCRSSSSRNFSPR